MAIATDLKKYLEAKNVPFEILQHPVAYTASEIAGSRHIPGKIMIKCVLIKADDAFILCVLPAIHLVDFDKLKKITQAKELDLASEEEIGKIFPEYEIGAEPPFGNLHGLKVYADEMLQENEEIVFNAGTHTDLVKMQLKDFLHLAQPILANFGRHV